MRLKKAMYLWTAGASMLVLALIAATSASAMPFHRGDVFVMGGSGIEEYSPEGTPLQLIEGSSGGDGFCFDPSGNYLIVPGAGLFDKQGRMLASNWASAYGHCVPDASGDVFIGGGSRASGYTISKYDIEGNLLETFNVVFPAAQSHTNFAIDLAPDECTMYYSAWLGLVIGRFNVCADTQEPPFLSGLLFADELRVLPNWEVLEGSDAGASLLSTIGQQVRGWTDPSRTNDLRWMSLDPDGTSFWMCCDFSPEKWTVLRFDLNSRTLLTRWTAIQRGPIAVYSPDNNGRGAG